MGALSLLCNAVSAVGVAQGGYGMLVLPDNLKPREIERLVTAYAEKHDLKYLWWNIRDAAASSLDGYLVCDYQLGKRSPSLFTFGAAHVATRKEATARLESAPHVGSVLVHVVELDWTVRGLEDTLKQQEDVIQHLREAIGALVACLVRVDPERWLHAGRKDFGLPAGSDSALPKKALSILQRYAAESNAAEGNSAVTRASERIIRKTSARRRAAMKVLANR